jgi:hypothetical protein
MTKQPCELCGLPDRLEHRQVKRVDLAPIVAGHILPTGMLLCRGCREMVDGAGPLVWVEDSFVFCKFSDGAFAKRVDQQTRALVIVDLPDSTTYRPGRSSWPPGLRPPRRSGS